MNVILQRAKRNTVTGHRETTGMICMMLDEKWTQCRRLIAAEDERTERRPTEPICREIWDVDHPPRPLD